MYRQNTQPILILWVFAAVCLGSCSDETSGPELTPRPEKGWVKVASPVDSLTLYSVWGCAPDSVVAVGDSGTVLSYDGAAWTALPRLTGARLNSVYGSSGDNVYAVGNDAAILRYNGTAWSLLSNVRSGDLTGVFVEEDGTVIICDAEGQLGSDQYLSPCGYVGSFLGVWSNSSAPMQPDQYAATDDGSISRYYRTESTPVVCGVWRVCLLPFRAIWGFSGSNIIAVGDMGTIYYYDGTDWTEMASGTTEKLRGVWGKAADDIYAVGDNGTIIHFDGTEWSGVDAGTWEDLYAVYGVSDNTIFAVGANGIILRRDL